MKISDKELDDLFSQKLNDLETEPNAAVWENIAGQLDAKPKKKSVVPALRMAAGIIVVLSVGLLFLRKNDQPEKNRHSQKIAKRKVEQVQPEIKQKKIVVEKKGMLLLSAKNKVIKEVRTIKKPGQLSISRSFKKLKPEPGYSSNQSIAQNKTEPDQHQDVVNTNIAQTKMAVVPDAAVSLKVQPEAETPLKTTLVKPQTLAAKNNRTAKLKHKGIRSIGDLVNLVMAKVDKRRDKLVEFSDSDDGDESNLTGVNLGIISIKKEK